MTGLTEEEIYRDSALTTSALLLAKSASAEDLSKQASSYDAIVNKLNLPARETSYSMPEILEIAQANVNQKTGLISESELRQLQLWSSYSARYGYTPTYTITESQLDVESPDVPSKSKMSLSKSISNPFARIGQ